MDAINFKFNHKNQLSLHGIKMRATIMWSRLAGYYLEPAKIDKIAREGVANLLYNSIDQLFNSVHLQALR